MAKIISWHYCNGGIWFRIFGYGLFIVKRQSYHPLFSERYGYRKKLWIGQWGIEWLKRDTRFHPQELNSTTITFRRYEQTDRI